MRLDGVGNKNRRVNRYMLSPSRIELRETRLMLNMKLRLPRRS